MRLKLICYLAFLLTNIILSIKYEYLFIDNLMLIFLSCLSLQFILRLKNLSTSIFELFLITYLFCSIQIVCLFELSSPGFFKNYVSYQDYRQLAIWGNQLLFIVFGTISILSFLLKPKKYAGYLKMLRNTKSFEPLFKRYIIFVLILQVITYILGLSGENSEPRLILPFHLNGIIDDIRTNWTPFILCIYVFDTIIKRRKIKSEIIVLYLIYAIFDVMISSSKSRFVMSFIPLITLFIVMNQMNHKKLIKFVLPLMAILIITYPIIEAARQTGQISFSSLYDATKNKSNVNDENESSPYIRTFLTGIYYTKVYTEIDNNYLSFDFRQIPIIVIFGGGSGYMTRYIDRTPEYVHHSSGITGLCDALIWGGYPLCYIVLFILTIFAFICDHDKRLCRKPLYKVILFIFFYNRIVGTTISFPFSPLFLSEITSMIIKILMVKYYYLKYY